MVNKSVDVCYHSGYLLHQTENNHDSQLDLKSGKRSYYPAKSKTEVDLTTIISTTVKEIYFTRNP